MHARSHAAAAAQAKELLEDAGFAKGGSSVVLGGAIIAGFFAAGCSLPFDFVKTRMQRMDRLPDGTYPYKYEPAVQCQAQPHHQTQLDVSAVCMDTRCTLAHTR